MRAGELDRRLTVQQRTLTQSGTGEAVETWSTFAQVWAKRVPVRANEYFAAQAVNAPVDARFQIRRLAGLDATMRLVYDGQTYDILSIQEIGRGEGHEIYAKVHRT